MENVTASTPDGIAELNRLHALQRTAQRAEPTPSHRVRQARLRALRDELLKRKNALAAAVDADFSARSPHETLMCEIFVVLEAIKHLQKNLKDWMSPRERTLSWIFQPAAARVVLQPLGVVGVIAPWNYPIQLSLIPLVTALAAGNRVLIKPSEFTPRTNQVLTELLAACLPEDVAAIIPGDVKVAVAFSQLEFDHLFFTGSTSVGRHVMRAAADNLTPVTLELGGKSPAIVHERYPLSVAAESIAFGKLLNAGQTCIAPDYVLVPRNRVDAFVEAFQAHARKSYPCFMDNDNYTSIINERHHARLQALIEDAESKGARILPLEAVDASRKADHNKMVPVIVLDGTDEMELLQDEIFGPILPVIPYDTLDDALNHVNERPRPLALYYFDHDKTRIQRVLNETTSGGVTINDTMLHVAAECLPFGGVGPSGMGAYHGQEGFEAFSHKKGVFLQSRLNSASLVRPPYGRIFDAMMKIFVR